MNLFITLETEIGYPLREILNKTTQELDFITNRETDLENINNYGTEFQSIAVIPTCFSDETWEFIGWKERKQIWRKKKEADIRLRMDYYQFKRSTLENKRLLFIDVLIRSLKIVQERSKGDFKGEQLINDVLNALDVTQEQLDNLKHSREYIKWQQSQNFGTQGDG